jgi:hypothetical protein
MSNTKHNPYCYRKSDNGTFYTDGPGHLLMRFDLESDARHVVDMMNLAWNFGRRTGRQDLAIAQAVEQEPMKVYPLEQRGFSLPKKSKD